MKRKACFIDRDGVLIKEENYISDPAKVSIIPGVPEALSLLKEQGYLRIVVSNQAGVARGYFEESQIKVIEKRIEELLAASGASVDAWYYCPHHPKGKVEAYSFDCDCRKPAPGMLKKAEKDFNIDVKESFLVGDKISDIEAGQAAGCHKSIMVRTGHGEEELDKNGAEGLIIAESFSDAVNMYLKAKNAQS